MIKGVIFDMDGTMFDTESVYGLYWRQLGIEYGYPMDDALVASMGGVNPETEREILIEHFGADMPASEIVAENHRRTRAHIENNPIPMKPGLMELLNALRERGIPMAVATGTRRAAADDMLQRAGVMPYLDAVICGDEVSACKPDPEIFLKAAALIGVLPQDCVVLEDSFNGIRAAHAAGAQPIMVPDTFQPTQEIRALCEHVFDRLDEVISLL